MTSQAFIFKPSVSGVSAATGFRVAAVKFKTAKTAKPDAVKKQNVYAELPLLTQEHLTNNLPLVIGVLKQACEDLQDSICREAVVGGKTQLVESEVNLNAIAAYFAQEQESGRLNGTQVTEWYTEAMEAKLVAVLSEKSGINEESSEEDQKKLIVMADVYKEKIVSLSSGRTKYPKDAALKLLRAFEVCDLTEVEDGICERLLGRLKGMLEEKQIELADL